LAGAVGVVKFDLVGVLDIGAVVSVTAFSAAQEVSVKMKTVHNTAPNIANFIGFLLYC
jgi:hypothetical protein